MNPEGGAPPLLQSVSRRKAAFWNFFFSFGSLALVLTRNIALVPLFVRYIGAKEYGAWLATGGVLMQLTALDFGLLGVVVQQVAAADGAKDVHRLERILGTGFAVVFALSLVMGGLCAAAASFAPAAVGVSGETARRLTWCILILAVASGVQLVGFASTGVLRGLQRTFYPGLMLVLAESLAIAVTTVLVVRGWGLFGIAIGLAVRGLWAAATTGTICAWTCYRSLSMRPRWDRKTLSALSRLSGYQFAAQLAGTLKTSMDPFIVGTMLGPETAGAYALTLRAHDTVRMFATSLTGSIGPALSHLFGEGQAARFRQVLLLVFRMMVVIGMIGYGGVFALNHSFVRVWAGEAWFAGQAPNVLAAVWGLVFLLTIPAFDGLYSRGEFVTLSRVAWFESIVRLPLIIGLLWAVGLWGAPAAGLATQCLAFGVPITIAALRRADFTNAEIRKGVRPALAPALALFILAVSFPFLFNHAESWLEFVWQAILYASIALGLVAALDRGLLSLILRRGRLEESAF